MQVRTLALALAAGLAAFLAVGAAVTELALRWIEFSLFVGLPVGAFGTAFLLALAVAVGVFSVPNSRALTLSTLVALGAAAGANALDLAGTDSPTG